MSGKTLTIGEDNTIDINPGLSDSTDGSFLNAASVTFTITDAAGVDLVSGVSMSYVPASDGQYEGTLDAADAAGLIENATYTIQVDGSQGTYDIHRRFPAVAVYHGAD